MIFMYIVQEEFYIFDKLRVLSHYFHKQIKKGLGEKSTDAPSHRLGLWKIH